MSESDLNDDWAREDRVSREAIDHGLDLPIVQVAGDRKLGQNTREGEKIPAHLPEA